MNNSCSELALALSKLLRYDAVVAGGFHVTFESSAATDKQNCNSYIYIYTTNRKIYKIFSLLPRTRRSTLSFAARMRTEKCTSSGLRCCKK